MDIISSKEIESTEAFKNINKSLQSIYLKRSNREIINNALVIHKNTQQIKNGLSGRMLLIVEEIIQKRQENDETKKKS
jgi:hypothetical protein